MRLSDFDFVLPEDSIALRPAEPRDSARLLVVRPGQDLADHMVSDLPDFLRPGDALVFNDTRVIPARLAGLREARTTGGGDGANAADSADPTVRAALIGSAIARRLLDGGAADLVSRESST